MFDLLMECGKPLTISSGVIFTKPAGAAENEENTQITHNVFDPDRAPGKEIRKHVTKCDSIIPVKKWIDKGYNHI